MFDLLEKHKAEAESIMRSAKGFVSYMLARSDDGGYSVTVFEEKSGVDESVEKAKEWVVKNAGDISAGAPEVSNGEVIIHVT